MGGVGWGWGQRKGSLGCLSGFELSASRSCFVWTTTVNELVNGKFTVPAGGPIKAGDGEDGERRRRRAEEFSV